MADNFLSCSRNSEPKMRYALEQQGTDLHLTSQINDLTTLKDFLNRYFIFFDKVSKIEFKDDDSYINDEINRSNIIDLHNYFGSNDNPLLGTKIRNLYPTLLDEVTKLRYQPLTLESKERIIEKQKELSIIKSILYRNNYLKYTLDSFMYPQSTTIIDNRFMSSNDVDKNNCLITFCEMLYALKQGFPYNKMKKEPHIYNNDNNKRSNINIPGTNDRDYRGWNGLLVIDIDLKYDPRFRILTPEQQIAKANEYIALLKRDIGTMSWCLAIKPSRSDKGIHIYTKVTKPFINHKGSNIMPSPEEVNKDYFNQFTFNYFHKSSIVYYLLDKYGVDVKASQRGETFTELKFNKDKNGKVIGTENTTKKYGEVVDLHTLSITQGINIAPKASTYINEAFKDEYFQMTLNEKPMFNGVEVDHEEYLLSNEYMLNSIVECVEKAFLNIPSLNEKSKQLEKIQKHNSNKVLKLKKQKGICNINDTVILDGGCFDVVNAPKRYDLRYSVCNTVSYLYPDDKDTAYALCLHLLQSKDGDPLDDKQAEIKAFLNTSYGSKKDPSNWVINQLKNMGYTIGLKDGVSKEDVKKDALDVAIETLNSATIEPNTNTQLNTHIDTCITLNKGEYLSDKKDVLINALYDDKLNYIESGAGTGKTHLFKELAKDKTVCLVLPFTSIIESKILSDKTITDYFKCYYGTGKEDNIKDVDATFNACMTFDKFTTLNREIINAFDYVVIDESHLLFESDYRSRICAMLLDTTIQLFNITKPNSMIEVISANSLDISMPMDNIINPTFMDNKTSSNKGCKLIFMSGTPSEETKYFSSMNMLNYIKVNSTSTYVKNATVIMCQDAESKHTHFINKLVQNIDKGIKNIVITNKGVEYQKLIECMVSEQLGKNVKVEYFKRANKENDINKDIMFNGQYPIDLDILFASSYLSVGVDIENTTETFNIFYPYNESSCEDIEQFNNRLRKTNKECFIYEIGCIDTEYREYIKEYKELNSKTFNITETIKNNDKAIFHEAVNNQGLFFNQSKTGYFCYSDHNNNIVGSESLVELYKYNPRSLAKKNMYYIINTLKFKYMYNINIIKNIDKDMVLIDNMDDVRRRLNEDKKRVLKDITLFLCGLDNLSNYKDYEIVDNTEIECIELINNEININKEYSHYIKDKNINILSIASTLKEYYDINTIGLLIEDCDTLTSLHNLVTYINFTDALDSDNENENKKEDIIIRDVVIDRMGSKKYITFDPKLGDVKNSTIKLASHKLLESYKKGIINKVVNTISGDIDLTHDDINKLRLMDNVDRVFKIMFIKSQNKGILTYTLRELLPFDSDKFEDDAVFDDVCNIEVKEIDPLKGKILNKVTKQFKQRLVKRLLKAYLKVEVLPTKSQTVKAIKDAYMDETGEVLTKKILETEYKDVYKCNSKQQITGLK